MRRECWKRGEVGEENQAAKRGVIFQRTVGGGGFSRGSRVGVEWGEVPAPVVPPARLEERIPGDWWMTRSRPAMVRSRVRALGSMKPRLWEGREWAKRSYVSFFFVGG